MFFKGISNIDVIFLKWILVILSRQHIIVIKFFFFFYDLQDKLAIRIKTNIVIKPNVYYILSEYLLPL